MDRKLLTTGAVAILVAIGVVAWWARGVDPAAPPTPPESAEPEKKRARTRVQASTPEALPEVLPAATDTAPPPPVPDTPVEEALDAAFPGKRWIRCATGGLVEDGALLRFLPPGRGAASASAVVVEAGQLSAVVDQAEGSGLLRDGMQAVARLDWAGARGDDGWAACSLREVDTVTLGGEVLWPDGSPAAGQLVRGCEPGELVRTDGGGRFELQVAAYRPCRVMAVANGPERFGVGPVVSLEVQDESVLDLVLEMPADEELRDVEAHLARLEAAADATAAMQEAASQLPTVFEQALADPELSAEARARLEGMARAQQALDAEAVDRVDRLAEEEALDAVPEQWLSVY